MLRKKDAPRTDVFRYEARHEGRTLVVLCGVETEAYPVGHKPDEPPLTRTFTFPTQEKARRFTEDVLTTLEYQNCLVNQHA